MARLSSQWPLVGGRAISSAGRSRHFYPARDARGNAGVTDIGARAGNKPLDLVGGAPAERAAQLRCPSAGDPRPHVAAQHGKSLSADGTILMARFARSHTIRSLAGGPRGR